MVTLLALYRVEHEKDCMVSDRVVGNTDAAMLATKSLAGSRRGILEEEDNLLVCLTWKIKSTGSLSSRVLTLGGISITCKLFRSEDEDVNHVFFRCDFASRVWTWICYWSGLIQVIPLDFSSFVDCVKSWNTDRKSAKLLLSLGYSVLWMIWKEMNERYFGKRIKNPMQLADDIQLFSFIWIKNIGHFKDLCWEDWCASPQCIRNL
ncbi:hypothetical protein LXL04_001922 [Taraxacum kok-saghyz]